MQPCSSTTRSPSSPVNTFSYTLRSDAKDERGPRSRSRAASCGPKTLARRRAGEEHCRRREGTGYDASIARGEQSLDVVLTDRLEFRVGQAAYPLRVYVDQPGGGWRTHFTLFWLLSRSNGPLVLILQVCTTYRSVSKSPRKPKGKRFNTVFFPNHIRGVLEKATSNYVGVQYPPC